MHVLRLNDCDGTDQDLKDRVHQRLLENSEEDEHTGCWIYLGAWDHAGRPTIRVGQGTYRIMRVAAWVYKRGFELWSAQWAFHICQTPACFNPEHLQIADSREEAFAKMRRLGVWHGERNRGGRRFKAADVVRIRRMIAEDPELTPKDVALAESKRLGRRVTVDAVRKVLRGETWSRAA